MKDEGQTSIAEEHTSYEQEKKTKTDIPSNPYSLSDFI